MSSKEMQQMRQMTMQMAVQTKMGEATLDYSSMRAQLAESMKLMPVIPGVKYETEILGGVEAEASIPDKLSGKNIVLYLHGGGYAMGNAQTSRGFASQLALAVGLKVYSVSYRLAPENPYPAGLNDCYTFYKELCKKYPDAKIALVGDSGGANFCLVLTQILKKEGGILPASLTLYSPPVDWSGEIDRTPYRDTDLTLSPELDNQIKAIYFGGADGKDERISPIYGDFTGFPPIKIDSDAGEVLRPDSELLAKKARAAGVHVEMKIWEETYHAFATLGFATPESAQVMTETVAFINKYFGE